MGGALHWFPLWRCHSSSSRGDRFVTAVQEVLKSYFTKYRDEMALDARSSRQFPTPRILDQKKFNLKRQASFHRNHTPSTHRQVDSFNCGCFVLHYVECAQGNVDNNFEMPRTSSYMEFYRQRILLSLCALWNGCIRVHRWTPILSLLLVKFSIYYLFDFFSWCCTWRSFTCH